MKKLLALLLAGAILCSVPLLGAADGAFHMDYAGYDGQELFGRAEVPDGAYFIRAVFFLPDATFFVMIIPISIEGTFSLDIAVSCVYLAVGIVDSPCAIVPGYSEIHAPTVVDFI